MHIPVFKILFPSSQLHYQNVMELYESDIDSAETAVISCMADETKAMNALYYLNVLRTGMITCIPFSACR